MKILGWPWGLGPSNSTSPLLIFQFRTLVTLRFESIEVSAICLAEPSVTSMKFSSFIRIDMQAYMHSTYFSICFCVVAGRTWVTEPSLWLELGSVYTCGIFLLQLILLSLPNNLQVCYRADASFDEWTGTEVQGCWDCYCLIAGPMLPFSFDFLDWFHYCY